MEEALDLSFDRLLMMMMMMMMMMIYICWRLGEIYQRYKIIFLMAQSVGTSILLHCSTQPQRAKKHALYLKLL